MDLWSEKIKSMSDDVLLLARLIVNTKNTFFIAKTDEKWFHVRQVIGDASGCRIEPDTVLPVGESYCGILFRTKEDVLLIEDATNDPRVAEKSITRDAVIGSYLGVRIFLSNGETYGTLCAVDPNPGKFTPSDVEALAALGRMLARTLDTERLAYRDPLADVFNRTYYNTLLTKESRDTVITVHLFDVDDFKVVNDELGHAEGDRLIQFIGRTLTEVFPDTEIIRLGGDEFCVISNQMSAAESDAHIAQVKEQLGTFHAKQMTASCGFATGAFRDLSSLLHEADVEMYERKSQHKAKRNSP